MNGRAVEVSCNCYNVTPDSAYRRGSVWNRNLIDLKNPFSYQFKISMGCTVFGADGMTFVLQRDTLALGNDGAGMGYQEIDSSIAVVIDTYQNTWQDDPPYDHITIMQNGDTYHNTPDNLAGPVMALANNPNIKDCQWHILKIDWQPSDSVFAVSLDGVLRLSVQKDIIKTIFNNNSLVHWGFTASTGYVGNIQAFCTYNNAGFYIASQSELCTNSGFSFTDTSSSFGSIINYHWNFGDSTSSLLRNPQHIYTKPGTYNVALNVTGNDGCIDTAEQVITVKAKPTVNFGYNIMPYCVGGNATFIDSTNLNTNSAANYKWDFGNGTLSGSANPSSLYYTPGSYAVKLVVQNINGCVDSIQKIITVQKNSLIPFSFSALCNNVPVNFDASTSDNTGSVKQWFWNFGDNNVGEGIKVSHRFPLTGSYAVQLFGLTEDGCSTDTVSRLVTINPIQVSAGNDTTIIIGLPYQLHASGGDTYSWSPTQGLSNPFIADPTVTITADATYILTVQTSAGCTAIDSLHLKAEKGPDIYAPTAFTPNNDGKNDRYKVFPVGITQMNFFKIYNRWGQLMYSSVNTSEGWDGNLNGLPQPNGTYIWIVSGKTINGDTITKKGILVLIK